MHIQYSDLKAMMENYEKLLRELKGNEEGKSAGLIISKERGTVRYYYTKKDPKSGRKEKLYIRKDQEALARLLAQESYNGKVRKLLEKRIRQLSEILKDFQDDEIDQIYDRLHPARKALISPIMTSYEQRLKKWKSQAYLGKPFDLDALEIYTKKGERVRSKTEKILADHFFDRGLDYKYECPLRFGHGITLYPDFTFLHRTRNEEIYWEHHGRMDDPNYVNKMINKLNYYEKHGISRSRNLVLSFESSTCNLDYHWVDALIEEYLLN